MERTEALVLRTTDWSETSRIATLWTRDRGKVRALAKGGRRLKSNFENALDLLTLCSIVLLRKPSGGGLELLTEAQVTRRFPRLQSDLSALYAGYYIAELLGDLTQELDPHPALFEETLTTLAELGSPKIGIGLRLMRFEMVFLSELGYRLLLTHCAGCQRPVGDESCVLSSLGGGVLCSSCARTQQDSHPLSYGARQLLLALNSDDLVWRSDWPLGVRNEVRQHLGGYVTALRGRPPRLLAYLGS